jgi:hypothetical protein
MSTGEDRVRTKFNPAASGLVDKIKQQTAALIDLCESMREGGSAWETERLASIAMERYEDAAHWAVKAATAPKPEQSRHGAA